MRKDIKKNVAQYKATKKALQELIRTIQVEMLPLMYGWSEFSDNAGSSMITFCDPKNKKQAEYVYGTEPGMYCLAIPGDYFIYLPKVTVAYNEFYDAITQLYKGDDTVHEKSFFKEVEFFHFNESMIKIQLMVLTGEMDNVEQMESHRRVMKELEEMLSDYPLAKFSCYEEDELGRKYQEGTEIPANYYIGIQADYDFTQVG